MSDAPPHEPSAGFRAGYVAIVGRPSVGKSTLLNRLVGQKVSITSPKAQTTRHRIVGIRTDDSAQFVFVDTPGYQKRHSTALNRRMNRAVAASLGDVDVVLLVIEAQRFGDDDRRVLALVPQGKPVVLVINKVDRLERRDELLPFIERLAARHTFAAVVPLSAEKGWAVDEVLKAARAHLPENPPFYEAEAVTDRSERFMAAELVREQLFRQLGEEVPYGTTVAIESFAEEEGGLRRISATVYVDRPGHKAIVIGAGGARLKQVGTRARKQMEELFGGKVFLEVWVKVREGWADDERALSQLGYE